MWLFSAVTCRSLRNIPQIKDTVFVTRISVDYVCMLSLAIACKMLFQYAYILWLSVKALSLMLSDTNIMNSIGSALLLEFASLSLY
jgi:hypothetical protein